MANGNFKKFVYIVAFIGTICVALALVLQAIFKGNTNMAKFTNAINIVGQVIAYSITCVSAFFYVKNKRNVAWMITYCVAVTVIIVMVILVNI